jgi:hypothetical protein
MGTIFPPFFSFNLTVQTGAERASGLKLRFLIVIVHFSFSLRKIVRKPQQTQLKANLFA